MNGKQNATGNRRNRIPSSSDSENRGSELRARTRKLNESGKKARNTANPGSGKFLHGIQNQTRKGYAGERVCASRPEQTSAIPSVLLPEDIGRDLTSYQKDAISFFLSNYRRPQARNCIISEGYGVHMEIVMVRAAMNALAQSATVAIITNRPADISKAAVMDQAQYRMAGEAGPDSKSINILTYEQSKKFKATSKLGLLIVDTACLAESNPHVGKLIQSADFCLAVSPEIMRGPGDILWNASVLKVDPRELAGDLGYEWSQSFWKRLDWISSDEAAIRANHYVNHLCQEGMLFGVTSLLEKPMLRIEDFGMHKKDQEQYDILEIGHEVAIEEMEQKNPSAILNSKVCGMEAIRRWLLSIKMDGVMQHLIHCYSQGGRGIVVGDPIGLMYELDAAQRSCMETMNGRLQAIHFRSGMALADSDERRKMVRRFRDDQLDCLFVDASSDVIDIYEDPSLSERDLTMIFPHFPMSSMEFFRAVQWGTRLSGTGTFTVIILDDGTLASSWNRQIIVNQWIQRNGKVSGQVIRLDNRTLLGEHPLSEADAHARAQGKKIAVPTTDYRPFKVFKEKAPDVVFSVSDYHEARRAVGKFDPVLGFGPHQGLKNSEAKRRA